MDSRLIAGAYSQHFRALERENSFEDTDKIDSIARAKKLSLETNKRRKSQAQKRKIEAQREEKRRHEILSKRREEQKQATEKYQRSHIPPSARQNSGRRSPRRPGGGAALEDALRLIRGSPRHARPGSARERVLSPRKENDDPFEKSYFSKPGYHMTRPGSGRGSHQIDRNAQAELMDHSLRNLTSSKTLFEQQLEQQQTLLLEQQEQSIRDFNNALRQEIDGDLTKNNDSGGDDNKLHSTLDNSCSSLDSLEESKEESESFRAGNCTSNFRQATGETLIMSDGANKTSSAINYNENMGGKLQPYQQYQEDINQHQGPQFYLHPSNSKHDKSYSPLNQDMTPSATYQMTASTLLEDQANNLYQSGQKGVKVGEENKITDNHSDLLKNGQTIIRQNSGHEPQRNAPLKQFSTDSLESGSSNISLMSGNTHHSALPSQTKPNETPPTSLPSQMAWISPSPSSDSLNTIPTSSTTGASNNDSTSENYNPRYASAISLSIWSGQTGSAAGGSQTNHLSNPTAPPQQPLGNNVHPYSSRGTLASTMSTLSSPDTAPVPRNVSIASTHSDTTRSDLVLKSGVVGSSLMPFSQPAQIPPSTLPGFSLTHQDLQCPQVADSKITGEAQGVQKQQPSQQMSPRSASAVIQNTYSQLPLSSSMYSQAVASALQGVNVQGLSNFQQPAQQTQQHQHLLQYKQQQLPQHNQHDYQQKANRQDQTVKQQLPHQGLTSQISQPLHGNTTVAAGIPVPAVRTVFPAQRPPVPKSETKTVKSPAVTTATALPAPGSVTGHDYPSMQSTPSDGDTYLSKPSSEVEGEEDYQEEEYPPIKGILKPCPVTDVQQTPGKTKGHPRDSLELARMQSDKKIKKKSVRFAEHHIEETFSEESEPSRTRNMVITNAGSPLYRSTQMRPASAKVVSTTPKPDISAGRGARAASAGTTRHGINPPSQVKGNIYADDSGQPTCQGQESAYMAQGNSTNLPPSAPHPVLSSGATTGSGVNRPKAAAHIIMSNSEQHGLPVEKQMTGAAAATSGQTAATAHKSQLECKVKNINSNHLMASKASTKIPPQASTVSVYHVARAGLQEYGDHHQQLHHQAFLNGSTSVAGANGGNEASSGGAVAQEQQRQRVLRDPSPASKRVPISNSVVTRTSIVPASTKISIPQSNSGAPSYSSSSGGGSASNAAVYDENGLRIDRTPTDEEITWLWDKVRNCLNKEDPSGGSGSGARVQNANSGGGGGGPDQARQAPTLSTKLIDGASLGFGLSTSSGVNGLRTGAGFFQPHPSPSVQSNKVRPAMQQQGSYLRRYGLLKQRRATSATGPASAATQQHQVPQRANSAVHTRQPNQSNPTSTVGQPQTAETDGPLPLTQAYVAQDGVSDSTAAFIMAERLAKQSLSDSHIQSGMQDAQMKQEIHNMRSRLTVNRGGHSALSIEEQNLLASLDKLNERLRVTDTKYAGSIQYHQPYQAHRFS